MMKMDISLLPFSLFSTYYCPENTSLWQTRGDGRFCDDVLTTKIPPNLPFPKGGISYIFMLLFGSKVHVRSIIDRGNSI
jgi:hypothetical protein